MDRKREIELIKQIHARKFCAEFNINIFYAADTYVLCHANYREDKKASLTFFKYQNSWLFKDHASGIMGSYIDYLIKCLNYDYVSAVKRLRELIYTDCNVTVNNYDKCTNNNSTKIYKVVEKQLSSLHIESLKVYRNISTTENIVSIDVYDNNKKIATAYAIKDINNNYHARIDVNNQNNTKEKRVYKTNTKKSTFSFINNDNDEIVIVEGIHDYLAFINLYTFEKDFIVLNSLSHVNDAVEFLNNKNYKKVILALDNDDAAFEKSEEFISKIKNVHIFEYDKNCKDLSEVLIKKRIN